MFYKLIFRNDKLHPRQQQQRWTCPKEEHVAVGASGCCRCILDRRAQTYHHQSIVVARWLLMLLLELYYDYTLAARRL